VTDSPFALIDTHAHLDDEQFAEDVEAVIERAMASGVKRILNIGYRPERWHTTVALAARFPSLSFTFGLHPHHAEEWSTAVETELIELIRLHEPVAIGEIGLDYFRNFNPATRQRAVFSRQLEIAAEVSLPVVIHQRAAERDLIEVLGDAPTDVRCVLHSFDGTAELAEFAMERGYFFGVGGLMTRSGSSSLRDVLSRVPIEHMLLETDSPYLVPAGIKNRRNEPANATVVAQRLATLVELSVESVCAVTTANAERVFGTLCATSATHLEGRT
jgi:TatD DNase family protein